MKNIFWLAVCLIVTLPDQAHGQGSIVYFGPAGISVNAIYGDNYHAAIDVDRDGKTDFMLNYSSRDFSLTPTNGNATVSSVPPVNRYGDAAALSPGAEISRTLPAGQEWRVAIPFYLPTGELFGVTGTAIGSIRTLGQGIAIVGPFAGIEAFLGFRITQADGDHYGWMRMDMIRGYGGQVVNVSEWAYNTVPGQPITAGQVPEPSIYALLGVGALCLWRFRRHRS